MYDANYNVFINGQYIFVWSMIILMKNVINELKVTSILTEEEIERIKLYVNKKYPNNSLKANAVILSRTMYGVIDKNLEGLSEDDKQNIRRNVIESTILKSKKNIFKLDVFDAYITELKENPQLKKTLVEWINKNQNNNVSQKIFDEYVMSIHNTRAIDRAVYLDIELQPENNVIKYHGLVKYKSVLTKIAISLLCIFMLSLYSINNLNQNSNVVHNKLKSNNDKGQVYAEKVDTYNSYVKDPMSDHPHMPNFFNYKSIDKSKLIKFLNTKNSILAEEPYFSAIIKTSKEFNLNPHILFAITGQEQSFVPKDHKNALEIANNPFNVFHSWQEYNTDIDDSSRIVARTVINLSKDKPNNIDSFNWINKKYAGDKNWGSGVKEIFETLNE